MLRVGGVIINGTSTWRTDQLAYGGVKASGIGRENGAEALSAYTQTKTVWLSTAAAAGAPSQRCRWIKFLPDARAARDESAS